MNPFQHQRFGMSPQGFGALSPGHTDQANQKVGALASRLSAQSGIITQARARGFAAGDVESLAATHAALLTELQALADETARLEDQGFSGWLERINSLEVRVGALEQQTQTTLTQGAPNRTWRIVGATVGSLALVSLLAWGIWYATGRNR